MFSEQYEQNRSLLKEDELIVVHGKVSKDEYSGGYRFSAERILDLGAARAEHARALKLRMNGAVRRRAGWPACSSRSRSASEQGPGCPVEIEYHNGAAVGLGAARAGLGWSSRQTPCSRN